MNGYTGRIVLMACLSVLLMSVVAASAADQNQEKVNLILTVRSQSPEGLLLPALGVTAVYRVKNIDLCYVLVAGRAQRDELIKAISKLGMMVAEQEVEMAKPSIH